MTIIVWVVEIELVTIVVVVVVVVVDVAVVDVCVALSLSSTLANVCCVVREQQRPEPAGRPSRNKSLCREFCHRPHTKKKPTKYYYANRVPEMCSISNDAVFMHI